MGNYWEKQRELRLVDKMKVENNFNNPKPFASISDEDLKEYSGIFIPGGHAPIADLGNDSELGRILWHFHNAGLPTAIICHGPYALLSTKYAKDSSGFAYEGYKITSWSDAEEKLVETIKHGEVPKVESALKENGANMVTGLQEKVGYITTDREVISGGNPLAAVSLGEKFVDMMKCKNG